MIRITCAGADEFNKLQFTVVSERAPETHVRCPLRSSARVERLLRTHLLKSVIKTETETVDLFVFFLHHCEDGLSPEDILEKTKFGGMEMINKHWRK